MHEDEGVIADLYAAQAALGSQAIDFGALEAAWDCARIGRDDFTVSSGRACPPPQETKGATAPTCRGLTLVASDGERLGRLGWMPGA